MAETQQQKLTRELQHKQGAVNQSARDNPLTGSALQALARGWLAGTAGLPGDLEGLLRSGINAATRTAKYPGPVDAAPALPTTDFYKEWLPGKQVGDENVAAVGSFFGGAGATQPVKLTRGALTRVANAAPGPLAGSLAAQRGVIKTPGGDWMTGSVEDALKGLKKPALGNTSIAGPVHPSADSLVNNFVDKQLTRYVRNDMATERDPIRALAERGTLHVDPVQLQQGQGGVISYAPAQDMRRAAGKAGGVAGKSAEARMWEDASDSAIITHKPESLPGWRKTGKHDWINKLPLGVPISEVRNSATANNLGFDHLIDELRNATNPASGLPRELLLKPESLARVSVPQAVEHVAKINAWREAQKVAANEPLANNAATHVFKEYAENNPKGLKWVELKHPGDDLPFQDAVRYEGDTMGHSVGGYASEGGYGVGGLQAARDGRVKLYSLRDAKGQPHVTVEVAPGRSPISAPEKYVKFSELTPEQMGAFDEYSKSMGNDPLRLRKLEESHLFNPESGTIVRASEVNPPPRVLQIKGKGNKKPNDEYLPFVQDFVKSGKWSDVGDLNNTGLVKHESGYLTADELRALGTPPGYAQGGPVPTAAEIDQIYAQYRGDPSAVNQAIEARLRDGDAYSYGSFDNRIDLNTTADGMRRAKEQRDHTARNSMSRDDFLRKYGTTFVADDRGGNAASEVAGQDVADYYDRYLAPGAKGDHNPGFWDGPNPEGGYAMPDWGAGNYRDAHPYFDGWDNVNPHPESQRGNGWDEAWKTVGRPVATAAAMYFGAGALGGALGGAGAGATTANGLAGLLGMSPGTAATMLNTGALNTGVGFARGQDFGTALKGGVTSALLSPVGGWVGDAVGGGTLGTIAGRTAVGGLQGLARGRGLADGLQQGLASGVVDSIGDYVGGAVKGGTGSGMAGTAAKALTKSTLRGKKPGATLDSLATQYALGQLTDLSGLDPKVVSIVVNLAKNKRPLVVGALSTMANVAGRRKTGARPRGRLTL